MATRDRLTARRESGSLAQMCTLRSRIAVLQGLGLSYVRIAQAARVNPTTVADLLKGHGARHPSTEAAIDRALQGFELPLLEHLVAVHGVPKGEGE